MRGAVRAIRRGDLDAHRPARRALDACAAIVAESACRDARSELTPSCDRRGRTAAGEKSVRRRDPHDAEGFATKRGRRAALGIARSQPDASRASPARGCSRRPPAAPSPRLRTTVSCSSRRTPHRHADEDFAIESMAGDIFQLGNASWRCSRWRAEPCGWPTRRVPSQIPFWFGEAPARANELSRAVTICAPTWMRVVRGPQPWVGFSRPTPTRLYRRSALAGPSPTDRWLIDETS